MTTDAKPTLNDQLNLKGNKVAAYWSSWRQIVYSSRRAQKEVAESELHLAYKMLGLQAPRQIIWAQSPLAGTLIASAVGDVKRRRRLSGLSKNGAARRVAGLFPGQPGLTTSKCFQTVGGGIIESTSNVTLRAPGSSLVAEFWRGLLAGAPGRARAFRTQGDLDVPHEQTHQTIEGMLKGRLLRSWCDSLTISKAATHLYVYQFLHDEKIILYPKIAPWFELAKHIFWISPHASTAVVSENPILVKFGRQSPQDDPEVYPRLASLRFRDGFSVEHRPTAFDEMFKGP